MMEGEEVRIGDKKKEKNMKKDKGRKEKESRVNASVTSGIAGMWKTSRACDKARCRAGESRPAVVTKPLGRVVGSLSTHGIPFEEKM